MTQVTGMAGIPLEKLLEQIPSDTEERVARARDRFNQVIREALRQESALRLRRDGGDDQLGPKRREPVTVKVALMPGLPVALQGKAIDKQHWLAAILAPWRHTLEQLRDSSTSSQQIVRILSRDERGERIVGGRGVHLPPSGQLADDLLKEINKFNLAKWIFDVNEDVLGIYQYRLPDKLFGDSDAAHIELYWAVIGLVAKLEGVPVEALTLVVQAHELAHAYTHLGSDIDGKRWTTKDFAQSEHELKEGLAQYYAALVCERLSNQEWNAVRAYKELLKDQPPAYHSHVKWLEDFTPEEVRLAVIETRRNGSGGLAGFGQTLANARARLRRPQGLRSR